MRKAAVVALAAFLLGAVVFIVCARWLERGRAEAAALASAGAAMALGGALRTARRRALPPAPPREARPLRRLAPTADSRESTARASSGPPAA